MMPLSSAPMVSYVTSVPLAVPGCSAVHGGAFMAFFTDLEAAVRIRES